MCLLDQYMTIESCFILKIMQAWCGKHSENTTVCHMCVQARVNGLCVRYKDGCDYMGEHKDDEKDLAPGHPIASLSLGQPRDFYFKHQDARGKKATRKMDTVKLVLEHGGLLLMNPPTNQFWYHALPQRKKLCNVRINLTFRKMNPAACKPVKSKESCWLEKRCN